MAAMLFCILKYILLNKIAYFSKIYYHIRLTL